MRSASIPIACALLSAGLAVGWQAAVASADYGSNWTAFYRTGASVPLPPVAASERIYRLQGKDTGGYDGQYYRLIAQDPLLLHGTERFIDAPRLRYRRILLPALAALIALGNPGAATYTYIATVIFFLALGAYWLSRYASLLGKNAWWGLAFLFVPAAFLSVDRLTTDIALSALTVGFALYLRAASPSKLFVVLLLAPLAKETGIFLVAACVVHFLLRRNWRRAALMACAAIPAGLWAVYVQRHTPDYPVAWLEFPFQAALQNMPHFGRYAPVEFLAWGGMLLAILLGIARAGKTVPLRLCAFFFAALAALVNGSVWVEVEAFGRVFSPLLILLPLEQPVLISFLPILAILPRAFTYPVSETFGVFRALLR